MNSNYATLLDNYIKAYDDVSIPFELIKNGEAPYSVYCYIRSLFEDQKYRKVFSEPYGIVPVWYSKDFITSYKNHFNCTLPQANKELKQVSDLTVAEHACHTLQQLLDEYGLNHHLISDILGFESSGWNKIFAGTRPPYREMVMAICMYLELDLERTEEIMQNCGFALIDGFPDTIYKNYILGQNYNVQSYVDAVLIQTITINRNRSDIRRLSGEKTPRNIKLPTFYRVERSFPTSSVSEFRNPDGTYTFNRKDFKDKLFNRPRLL